MNRLLPIVVTMLALGWGGFAAAQTLSESTYRRLTRIHEDIGDEKYQDALESLDKLMSAVKYSPYEQAVTLQTYGFVYAQLGKYDEAAGYFRKALSLDALPPQQVESMKYQLAQFHIAVEQYSKGASVLEEYLRSTENPVPADAYVLLATAYAQLGQFRRALPSISKAIDGSDNPREMWYQLKLALHYELNDYPASARTLLQMVARFPLKEDYWKQLSGMYLELKKDADALAILALAERQRYLDTGKEIVNLTNLYLFLDIPYKAAKFLERGFRQGVVEQTDGNYELLANAWLGAKEYDQAISALSEAAKRTKDGEIVLRLAFLYLEKENWPQVLNYLGQARKLGLKKPGEAALIQGIAAAELGRFDEALNAFAEARKHDSTQEQAAAWTQHALTLRAEAQADAES